MRIPPVAAAILAIAFGLAGALAEAGPDAGAWAMPALVSALGFAIALPVAYGLARLAARDPERGWALSANAALAIVLLAGVVGFVAGLSAGAAIACGLAAGYLHGRGSPHASDVAFLGVTGLVAGGVSIRPSAWDEAAAFLAPAAAVALALLARETWDLAALRRNARERARDAMPRDATLGAQLAALGVLAAALLVALALGLTRDAWRSLGWGDLTIRVLAAGVLLAAEVGLARLYLAAKPKTAR